MYVYYVHPELCYKMYFLSSQLRSKIWGTGGWLICQVPSSSTWLFLKDLEEPPPRKEQASFHQPRVTRHLSPQKPGLVPHGIRGCPRTRLRDTPSLLVGETAEGRNTRIKHLKGYVLILALVS